MVNKNHFQTTVLWDKRCVFFKLGRNFVREGQKYFGPDVREVEVEPCCLWNLDEVVPCVDWIESRLNNMWVMISCLTNVCKSMSAHMGFLLCKRNKTSIWDLSEWLGVDYVMLRLVWVDVGNEFIHENIINLIKCSFSQ